MATDYKKSLTDLVATVQKESQADFERAYHRKSCLTKLTLCVGVVEGLTACFDKAAQDSATPKSQAGTYKAKRDLYMKFHDKIVQYRDSLKATENEKSAKQQIEKFDLTN